MCISSFFNAPFMFFIDVSCKYFIQMFFTYKACDFFLIGKILKSLDL